MKIRIISLVIFVQLLTVAQFYFLFKNDFAIFNIVLTVIAVGNSIWNIFLAKGILKQLK